MPIEAASLPIWSSTILIQILSLLVLFIVLCPVDSLAWPGQTSSSFVLVEPPFRIEYPLLGFLPWTASLLAQTILIGLLVLLIVATTLLRSVLYENLADLVDMLVASGLLPSFSWKVGLGSIVSSARDASGSNSRHSSSSLRRHKPIKSQPGFNKQAQKLPGDHHPGLINAGNTCFFNSVIQSLASVKTFVTHIQRIHARADEYDVPTPVIDALVELLVALNTPASKRSAIRPTALSEALSIVTKKTSLRSLLTAHQQQDAHELLLLLLDAVSIERNAVLEEMALVEDESKGSGLAGLLGKSVQIKPEYVLARKKELMNPFEGLVAQRTACLRCGYYDAVRNYPQEELSLTVPVQRQARGGDSGVSLEDCLAQWAQLEGVEWRCWRCTLNFNLSRAEVEVTRMEQPPASHANSSSPSKLKNAGNGHVNPNGNDLVSTSASNSKLTASAKKRLKEARKIKSILTSALSEQLTEEQFRSAHPAIRMTPPPLSPPDASGSSITATKQTLFSRAPASLALHLNRSMFYGSGAGKNNTRVEFGEYLDLTRWCIAEGVESSAIRGMNVAQPDANEEAEEESWSTVGGGKSKAAQPQQNGDEKPHLNGKAHQSESKSRPTARAIYRLDSIVVHYGGHSFGHYVSYRRRPRRPQQRHGLEDEGHQREAWLRISDDSVQTTTLSEVLGQQAFLILYERIDESATPAPPVDERKLFPINGNGAATSAVVARALQNSERTRGRLLERWMMIERLSREPEERSLEEVKKVETVVPNGVAEA